MLRRSSLLRFSRFGRSKPGDKGEEAKGIACQETEDGMLGQEDVDSETLAGDNVRWASERHHHRGGGCCRKLCNASHRRKLRCGVSVKYSENSAPQSEKGCGQYYTSRSLKTHTSASGCAICRSSKHRSTCPNEVAPQPRYVIGGCSMYASALWRLGIHKESNLATIP